MKSTEDLRAKALKNQIDLIKEAYTEYKKLREIMSEKAALAKVQAQFGGVLPDGLATFDLNTLLTAAVTKAKGKKSTPAINQIGKEIAADIAKGANDEMVDSVKSIFDTLANQIETYKSKFDFFKQLVGGGVSEKEAGTGCIPN